MSHVPKEWRFDEVFDAVDLGCGEFLIDFNMHIRPLPAGTVVMLATRDIASPMEVPAWCRLTGHRLLEMAHPFYLIRKMKAPV
ncbi:MAG: sulfurtransferase TusA family protein [Planctomycetota bacterium]